MRIFIINLASEAGRWNAVSRQFRAVGLAPERFDAIAGAALAPRDLRRLYSPEANRRQYHKPLQPGEIGCYASHIALWRRLLDSGEKQMAVFEDDIDIALDLPQTLAALGETPGDCDLVKLMGRQRERALKRHPLVPGRDLVRYRRVPGLTCSYVLNRRGAAKLLEHRVPFGRPIDVDLRHWWECDLRIAGVHPYPTCPAPSSLLSTIDGRRAGASLATRTRKLLAQARYSLLNWQAVHFGVAPAAPPAPRRPARILDHLLR